MKKLLSLLAILFVFTTYQAALADDSDPCPMTSSDYADMIFAATYQNDSAGQIYQYSDFSYQDGKGSRLYHEAYNEPAFSLSSTPILFPDEGSDDYPLYYLIESTGKKIKARKMDLYAGNNNKESSTTTNSLSNADADHPVINAIFQGDVDSTNGIVGSVYYNIQGQSKIRACDFKNGDFSNCGEWAVEYSSHLTALVPWSDDAGNHYLYSGTVDGYVNQHGFGTSTDKNIELDGGGAIAGIAVLNDKLYVTAVAFDPSLATKLYQCDTNLSNCSLIETLSNQLATKKIAIDTKTDQLYLITASESNYDAINVYSYCADQSGERCIQSDEQLKLLYTYQAGGNFNICNNALDKLDNESYYENCGNVVLGYGTTNKSESASSYLYVSNFYNTSDTSSAIYRCDTEDAQDGGGGCHQSIADKKKGYFSSLVAVQGNGQPISYCRGTDCTIHFYNFTTHSAQNIYVKTLKSDGHNAGNQIELSEYQTGTVNLSNSGHDKFDKIIISGNLEYYSARLKCAKLQRIVGTVDHQCNIQANNTNADSGIYWLESSGSYGCGW